jgi:hypothetical protein
VNYKYLTRQSKNLYTEVIEYTGHKDCDEQDKKFRAQHILKLFDSNKGNHL